MTRLGNPPEDYLRECSSTSLRYFEMSKLEHVANLRRELSVLLDEMMEESALALFARWMLEKRAGPAGSSIRGGPGTNGNEAKSGVSRHARRLLEDFVSASARAHASSLHAEGSNGKSRPAESEATERPGTGAVDWQEIFPSPKEHVPPPRGSARSEKRLDRKSARPARLCARASGESQ